MALAPGVPAGPPEATAEDFLRRFRAVRFATWNAAQLLGGWFSSAAGLAAKRRRLRALLERNDVVLLQETRGIPADLEGLPPSHRYWGTFAPHRSDAAGTDRGGAVVAVRADWAASADAVDVGMIARARAVGVSLRWGRESLSVASVQLDPALPPRSRVAFLRALRDWADRTPQGFRVIGRDWNFVPTDEVRMSGDGADVHSADRTGEHFERIFDDYAEVYQPDYTRSRRLASGAESTRSRIDRIYTGLDHVQAARIVWSASVVGNLSEAGRASDHVPVAAVARLRTPRACSASPVPPYIFALPQFWERFEAAATDLDAIVDPGFRLDAYVEEMRRAAAWARSLPASVLQGGAILRAVAADRAGDAQRARRFLEAVLEAGRCLVQGGIDRERACNAPHSCRAGACAGTRRFGAEPQDEQEGQHPQTTGSGAPPAEAGSCQRDPLSRRRAPHDSCGARPAVRGMAGRAASGRRDVVRGGPAHGGRRQRNADDGGLGDTLRPQGRSAG